MPRDVPEIERLARCIDTIARRCWRGLPALMGKAPQPTREQLKAAFFFRPSGDGNNDLGVKIHGGEQGEGRDIEQADYFIDNVDPAHESVAWDDLVGSVQWYAKAHPEEWRVYVEYLSQKETGRACWDGKSVVERLADKNNVSEAAIYDIIKKTPRNIARAVSIGCYELFIANF